VKDPRLVSRREIYEGRVFGVTVDRFADDERGVEFDIEIVHHNGGAGTLAVTDEGTIVLIRQWRYPLGRFSLEIPAGRIEPGDVPEATARRELEEETGLRATRVEPLAEINSGPGFTTERLYLYLATGLTASSQRLDEDERIEIVHLSMDEALAAVDDGRIDDAKTVVAILRGREKLKKG
jgi:ADP-ribose pyrophosphatase